MIRIFKSKSCIRQLGRKDPKLAKWLALQQTRAVLDLPITKAVVQGAEALTKKFGPGVWKSSESLYTTAVLKAGKWVPTKTYHGVKGYLSLSKRAFELGGRGGVLVREGMSNAKARIVASISRKPLVAKGPGAKSIVSTQVRWTDDTAGAARYGFIGNNIDGEIVKGSNIFDQAKSPDAPLEIEEDIVVSAPKKVKDQLVAEVDEYINRQAQKFLSDLRTDGTVKPVPGGFGVIYND